MRLFSATLLLCALVGSSAFADDPPKGDAVAAPKVETVKKDEPVVAPKVEEAPIVIPEHPLADTSRAKEEAKQLRPEDTDAALNKVLGLDEPKREEAVDESEGLGWQLFKTLLVLGVVLALVYLVLNVGLRRMMGIKGAPLGGTAGVVNVLERIPLEQRRTMFVVRAAGEYLLIGTSEGGMTMLAKLDTAEVERIQRERGAEKAQLSPFFQKLLSGQKKSGPPPQA